MKIQENLWIKTMIWIKKNYLLNKWRNKSTECVLNAEKCSQIPSSIQAMHSDRPMRRKTNCLKSKKRTSSISMRSKWIGSSRTQRMAMNSCQMLTVMAMTPQTWYKEHWATTGSSQVWQL